MAPTLYGESDLVRCAKCDLQWLVDSEAPREGMCWHCGDPVAKSEGERVRGSRVSLVADRRSPKPGEWVAFTQVGHDAIKRVVGIPGDTIAVRGLKLLVNGRPIQFDRDDAMSSMIPVDLNDHRERSRWQETTGAWMVYHHASVHYQNRSSQVWDDYPVNFGLSRRLEPVENLIVSGTPVSASPDCTLEVMFWSSEGSVSSERSVPVGSDFRVDQRTLTGNEMLPLKTEELPVAPEKPVAIRVLRGTAKFANLAVHRPIEYRLRPRDDRKNYPMTLSSDQYFVLGDNVPISVDSRDFGPITSNQIIGVVQAR